LIRLIIEAPAIGIPVTIVVIVVVVVQQKNAAKRAREETWDSAPVAAVPRVHRPDLGAIRRVDPLFSSVLFTDFVYALYARAHGSRGDPQAMEALSPYIAAESRATLLARDPAGVKIRGVVIGSMTVERVRVPDRPDGFVEVELGFESNYSAALPGGERGFYVREQWRLRRRADARTRAPEAVTALGCPSCGAPFERSDEGACRSCGSKVEGGRFDWEVFFVRLRQQESRPPPLMHHAEEVGTDDRTLFAPTVQQDHAQLIAEDPTTAPEQIERRVRTIHAELNGAWTALDLRRARPYVSDALFNYLQYWIDAYRAQGLRNVLKDYKLLRMVIVKVERDAHYDAITVRIWATGIDYTARANGERVSGSAKHPRTYSEYWTLIRGSGVRGRGSDPAQCPNCGAPLDRVSMAGACEYCGAHLTRGEFDWVLSKIEQDEAYAG
ncbi:MAG TPA: Tim44-like domain-containing protein, partial [Nannocystis sp.]